MTGGVGQCSSLLLITSLLSFSRIIIFPLILLSLLSKGPLRRRLPDQKSLIFSSNSPPRFGKRRGEEAPGSGKGAPFLPFWGIFPLLGSGSVDMAQHAHVPKFGNWESDENAPYTKYFDNARKGKAGGKLINPNDPQENPDAFSKDIPLVQAPPFRIGSDPEAPKPKDERRASREDDYRQLTDSPLYHDALPRKSTTDSPHHRYGDRPISGDPQKRAGRTSGGSDHIHNIEHSPLHPHYQVKAVNRGGASSPSWERKGSSEGSHGHTSNSAGRSRLKAGGRGDETPEKGSAVPKFGEWDENNPSSADGFTHIFNKVREEKQTGSAKVPVISNDIIYPNGHNQGGSHQSSSCSCFGWCGK
ncbi:RPM1-interacting protein 4 isoform X1 [Phoenix dactylifera]|uniref:RPM1-interacting protein 4 isoform X1 n=1 Tax=Phoenix dactylifera TaxID=42345 RepID=A0A8B7CMD3_PHODC|nr:RPM1-interacting protein 4 isoform X1 [Phoenix dactylifera]